MIEKINKRIASGRKITICSLTHRKNAKWKKTFYAPPPNRNKIPPKRENFFHFSRFSLKSLVTLWWQKTAFCHQQVTKFCSENFEKWKKFSLFWGIFFFCLGGGGIKKKLSKCNKIDGKLLTKKKNRKFAQACRIYHPFVFTNKNLCTKFVVSCDSLFLFFSNICPNWTVFGPFLPKMFYAN